MNAEKETIYLAINETDLTIMRYLLENNYISPRRLITISELKEHLRVDDGTGNFKTVGRTTVSLAMKKLTQLGYINMGAKIGKTQRYFISPNGAIAYYENIHLSDEEKQMLVRAYSATITQEDNSSDWSKLFNEINSNRKED